MLKRIVIVTSLLVSVLLGVYFLPNSKTSSGAATPLPEIQLDVFEPASRKHIKNVLAKATANKNDVESVGKLGMVLHAYRQHDAAAVVYQRTTELQPENYKWYYYLGISQARLGNNEAAITAFIKALNIRPKNEHLHARLADSYLATGNAEKALEHYRKALKKNPQSVLAGYGLGKTQHRLGKSKRAAKLLANTLKLSPKWGAAHYQLGLVYRDLKQVELAKKHLKLSEIFKGNNPSINDRLLNEIAQLDRSTNARTGRAAQLANSGKVKQAIDLLEDVVRVNPDHVPAYITLIELYRATGNFEAGEKHFYNAMNVNPNAQNAIFSYAQLLVSNKMFDQAIKQLKRLIIINPENSGAYLSLGAIYDDLNKPKKAIGYYKTAVTKNPRNPNANYLMGRRLLLDGKKTKASKYITDAQSLEKKNPAKMLKNIGNTYEQVKDKTTASKYYVKARNIATKQKKWRMVARLERLIAKVNCGKPLP